jgi:GNAT superfamily N-acetyltransferase
MLSVEIVEADLNRKDHQHDVIELIDAYAVDPMGNGKPLSDEVRRALIPALQQHPTSLIFLAYRKDKAIGIATCFLGFSTFAAKPLIHIDDLSVLPAHRRQGVGQRLLTEIEEKAREMDCCKLTLQVQENNHSARQVYAAAGFAQAEYVKAAGVCLSLSKPIVT